MPFKVTRSGLKGHDAKLTGREATPTGRVVRSQCRRGQDSRPGHVRGADQSNSPTGGAVRGGGPAAADRASGGEGPWSERPLPLYGGLTRGQ